MTAGFITDVSHPAMIPVPTACGVQAGAACAHGGTRTPANPAPEAGALSAELRELNPLLPLRFQHFPRTQLSIMPLAFLPRMHPLMLLLLLMRVNSVPVTPRHGTSQGYRTGSY